MKHTLTLLTLLPLPLDSLHAADAPAKKTNIAVTFLRFPQDLRN